nr:iron ABC transporter permease [Reinekea blandensis]
MKQRRFGKLSTVSVITATLLSTPLLVIVLMAVTGKADVWSHLWQTVLGDYVTHSLRLVVGVAIGVLLLGVSTAWLTACCEFPGRKLLSLLLLLPMAMPAYIIAYAYTGLLDFAGPIQTWIRATFELRYGEYWFFNIHSVTGATLMLSLVLYPYVYLMARAAFLAQSAHIIDVSRSLGATPSRAFFRVALPMARPAIVAGLSLAMMETLADYGTVQYFGVPTFTTGIFRTFYGFGDAAAAAQLAVVLLTFVILLVVLEKYSRRRISYFQSSDRKTPMTRLPLQGLTAWLTTLWCLLPVSLGFLLPFGLLAVWSTSSNEWVQGGFIDIAVNSLSLAAIAALVAVLLALVFAYAARISRSRWVHLSVQVTSLGYALPGTIIAIGVLVSFAWIDHHAVAAFDSMAGTQLGLLFSGTLIALVFAYTTRFLAVSLGAVQSGLQTIKPSLDSTARLLGRTPLQVLREIHVPMLKGSVLTAFLIVFVDVLKELPATLMLRPFNFNTLAVRAYELASDERLIDAAPASVLIVLVGLIPVFFLNRSITKR